MTDLAGRSVILLGAGQFSDAFLVGERVVRVPKSQVAMEGLRREVEFLAATRDQLRAQVPRVLETRFDMGPDEAFVVHGLIPGDVLHSAWLREMTEDELSGVAAEVANFVRSLHALAPDRAGSGLERSDLGSWWTALISAVEDEVVPHLAQDVGARFSQKSCRPPTPSMPHPRSSATASWAAIYCGDRRAGSNRLRLVFSRAPRCRTGQFARSRRSLSPGTAQRLSRPDRIS